MHRSVMSFEANCKGCQLFLQYTVQGECFNPVTASFSSMSVKSRNSFIVPSNLSLLDDNGIDEAGTFNCLFGIVELCGRETHGLELV